MKLIILGSGGAIPTPRPFCQCKICKKARKFNKYKRNSSSLFISDINTLIDCGEDISNSLNKKNIKTIDNLFITHWHPDHTFGLRIIAESNFDFYKNKAEKTINIYIPKNVFETLQQQFPAINYYINIQKTLKLHLLEDKNKLNFKNIDITVVGYQGKKSNTYAYLISEKNKNALYAPCDTISFNSYKEYKKIDLLINECGIFSDITNEISFDKLIERIKEIKPKKTILTHIEEVELKKFGEKHFKKIKNKYKNLNIDFATDGLEIEL